VSLSPVETPGDTGGGGIVAEINVTPLTDIFLVLLIIFMVTSTALLQQGTKVNLPHAGATSAGPGSIIVTATADHRLELNGIPVQLEMLKSALQGEMARTDTRYVVMQGDRSIVLQDAVEIMTIAREAGAESIAIATTPKPAKR
jgi:biopolymer transport protein ExbD